MIKQFPKHILLVAFLLLMGINGISQKEIESNQAYAKPENYSVDIEMVIDGKPIAYEASALPKAVYDACASATTVTVDGAQITGSTSSHSLEGGESTDCVTAGGGISLESSWHRFSTGSNTALNLSWTYTNTFNCFPGIVVWGPFAAGTGCLPAGASVHCTSIQNGDPGYHRQLAVSANSDYLVQIIGRNCGGGSDRFVDYQLGVYTVPGNDVASGADGIDQCGLVYNGTNIGYAPTNGVPGLENLDGNAGTTCGACGTAGDDVSYVVNNDSWFTFCATTAGTWNVDFNNISNCVISSGLQMTIFRGTATNLTQIENAPSPSAPGSSWTSANFAVAAGECIYMVVDGFAGDQCDYSYTLNNVTGGCNLLSLPVELVEFTADRQEEVVELNWTTATEVNNSHFTILRSKDGESFDPIMEVAGAGNSSTSLSYKVFDRDPLTDVSYYRLRQTDFDGKSTDSEIVSVKPYFLISELLLYPNPTEKGTKLAFHSQSSREFEIIIQDVSGRIISLDKVKGIEGVNTIDIDSENFPKGIYLITVKNEFILESTRLVKG